MLVLVLGFTLTCESLVSLVKFHLFAQRRPRRLRLTRAKKAKGLFYDVTRQKEKTSVPFRALILSPYRWKRSNWKRVERSENGVGVTTTLGIRRFECDAKGEREKNARKKELSGQPAAFVAAAIFSPLPRLSLAGIAKTLFKPPRRPRGNRGSPVWIFKTRARFTIHRVWLLIIILHDHVAYMCMYVSRSRVHSRVNCKFHLDFIILIDLLIPRSSSFLLFYSEAKQLFSNFGPGDVNRI